jgi:methylation protein EvaC
MSSNKSIEVDDSVVQTAREESRRGVGNIAAITEFSENVRREMSTLNAWVNAQPTRSIIAYGAAAKTVTTFFAADLNENKFSMIVDANPLKQGNRLPGTSLPILGLDQLLDVSTSKLVIFPWNLEDEIVKNVRSINAEIEIWVLNPLRRVN